jgi:hypothetical protein
MDFSKLNGNEKLAAYGAIASIVGPILASLNFGFGVGFFTLLLALAMLAIVFMPQLSPSTTLPGSKGSLMLVVGGIAAVSAALALLSSIGWLGFFGTNVVFVLGWLIGIAGGLLMGWAGWQEFQAEGGEFRLGAAPAPGRDTTNATASAGTTATGTTVAAPTSTESATSDPTATERSSSTADEPPASDEERRPAP